MKVKHPLAGEGDGSPSSAVDVNGENVPVDEDGTFDVGGNGAWVSRFADAHDVEREDILVDDSTTNQGDAESETCQEVKDDGEVCGRDLPCPYHSED